MADANGEGYLSIGEVLGLLLEEFPDVTISKIRFLESQGLISPERTASGYRKFYDDDVDLLRVILTEQRQNFLPLRVIKDRLETGEIDPTGEHLRPEDVDDDDEVFDAEHGTGDDPTAVPSDTVASHPASRTRQDATEATEATAGTDRSAGEGAGDSSAPSAPSASTSVGGDPTGPRGTPSPQLLPGVMLDRTELCSMVGMTDDELDQLEEFGVIQPERDAGGTAVYGDDAVDIATPACAFLRAGIDARHLRSFRTAADREASLYEQVVTPRFRQRNPEARAEALRQLRHLDGLGAKLRAAMTRHALGHHFK